MTAAGMSTPPDRRAVLEAAPLHVKPGEAAAFEAAFAQAQAILRACSKSLRGGQKKRIWALCCVAKPRHSPCYGCVLRLAAHPKPLLAHSRRDFEQALTAMPGYLGHELQCCIEHENHYLLLVRWQTLEDHTQGFRGSPQYQQWKALLHHFYDPFPTVLHYRPVFGNAIF